MKILLVSPVKDATKKTVEMIKFPMIALYYIASMTPERHEVIVVEEEEQTVDYDTPCDLVGITCMTATAPRAYEMATEFRKRGRTVVLGGIHPTVLPFEAKDFCDCVVTGEAEPVWEQLLTDFENGCLQGFYHGGVAENPNQYPLPKRELVKSGTALGLQPIVTSRGCPFSCEFCSVWKFFGRKIRHVSVENVLTDIQNAKTNRFMFLDDNIVGDPGYAKSLFLAMKEMDVKWVGQASISFSKNEELLNLAYESGCRGLFFGVESVSEEKIKRMSKSMRNQEETIDAIKRILGHGIFFHASLVFGFDDDDESVFDETLEFLHKTKIPSATFNILTPYPGTDLYERMKKEDRLITENWEFYDHCTVTYRPKLLTIDKLYEGYEYAKKSFYSLDHILGRFPANIKRPLIFAIANAGIKKSLKGEKATIRENLQKLHSIIDQKPVYNTP